MADRNLGKIFITPKGSWSNSVSYDKLDLVTYTHNNILSAYLSKDIVPVGTLPTNEDYWICICSGTKGDIGKSAYDIAIENGFTGNEQEWLSSLQASVKIDMTLTKSGQVADAKAVGDALSKKITTPSTAGIQGQVLKTNGNGTHSWSFMNEVEVSESQPTNENTVIWIDENEISENEQMYTNLFNDVSELKNNSKNYVNANLLSDVINDTPHAATIADYFKMKKNYNIYSVKIWLFSTNPTTSCDKLGLNASLNFTPSTDTVEGEDDYLNGEHTLFQWFNCNYIRQADGSPVVTATEFDDTFATTGSVDVGCVQMPFYIDIDKSHEDEGYHIMSISADRHILRTDYNFVPWSECVNASGEILPYTVGSKYMSGVGADGLPRSQPNLAIKNFESHNTIITNYGKKGEGYHGAGIERNTFQIIFTLIKAAQKSSQKVFMGCTNYNFQYNASVQSEESHTYFPVTNAQAANIVVGSTVSIGYAVNNNGTLNNDRGQATVRSYADKVKVLRIETLDENNKAVYLDVDTPFNTMPHVYSETLSAPIIISSMPWHSGSTDCVIGRHDGSMGSNTNGKYPYRVQGREYAVGTYFIPSDAVMIYEPDHGTKDVYICPKGSPRSTSDAVIRSTYDMIGRIPIVGENNSDWWIGDITFDLAHGASFPTGVGDSDAHGVGDRVYAGGANASGSREMLMGGPLWNGSSAGSSCVVCGNWLSGAFWGCAAAD